MRVVVLLVLAGLALVACGEDRSGSPTSIVCGYVDHPGGQQRFVVGFRPGSDLADDEQARAELFGEVGAERCALLTEVDPPLTDAVVVRSDRPLSHDEARELLTALERDDDVVYAEPDRVVTPDATVDGGSTQ
jgi:hypothetical protein